MRWFQSCNFLFARDSFVAFVFYFADEFFEDVFERHDADGLFVVVFDNGEMLSHFLEFLEEMVDTFFARDDESFKDNFFEWCMFIFFQSCDDVF